MIKWDVRGPPSSVKGGVHADQFDVGEACRCAAGSCKELADPVMQGNMSKYA